MNRPLFILILVPVLVSCYSDPVVMGKIVKKVSDGDSIFFVSGTTDEKYFAEPVLSAEIKNQEFELLIEITYPQMYKTALKSDRPEILYSGGFYFLDMYQNIYGLIPTDWCMMSMPSDLAIRSWWMRSIICYPDKIHF